MPLTQPDHPTSLWWPHPHTLADVVAHETRTSRDARVREYVRPCRRENPSAWAGPFVFPFTPVRTADRCELVLLLGVALARGR